MENSILDWLIALPKWLLLILFLCCYVLFLWLIHIPDTFIVLDARSEGLEFIAKNPSQAAFNVSAVKLVAENEEDDRMCLTGFVQPPKDAKIRYVRRSVGNITIDVEPVDGAPSQLIIGNDTFTLSGAYTLIPEESCPDKPQDRFPVWGAVDVGEQYHAARPNSDPPYSLLSGSLMIYGRSMEIPLINSDSGLYHVSTLTLHAGTRVLGDERESEEDNQWWGMVIADGQDGLWVTISTEMAQVSIYPPGSRVRPDTMEIRLFARATHDPLMIFMQAVILGFLGILGFWEKLK